MNFETLETHRTGDINFFSACMAIGIAPCFPEPVEVMQNDDGNDYLSFRLNAHSECGMHETKEMNRAWSYPVEFKQTFPVHPFTLLMDFCRECRGARKKEEFIERAASSLTISRDAVRKALRDITQLEHRAPESPLTYLVCFIANRFAAIDWAKSAVPKIVVNKGPSIVMLDGKLSRRKQNQLLSYL